MEVGDLGDFVIARSFDEPVFHFAVVVDDADEKVTHVIRGEDHISNTPRQILIQRALGFATPVYAHLPLILGSDRTKLSKRSGAKALIDYRDSGYLPEAMLNYLAFLGWNPGDEREYLSREELIEAFDISRVQKGSAFFDETKLLSVNQHWMRELSDDDFLARGNFTSSNLDKIRKAIPLMKERARTFEEAQNMIEYELAFIFTPPEISADSLPSPDRPQVRREWLLSKAPSWHVGTVKNGLKETCNALEALGGDVSPRIVKDTLMPIADAAGMGDGRGAVLWALRFALSGQERSPDPFTLISILGKEEAISRIRKAIAIL